MNAASLSIIFFAGVDPFLNGGVDEGQDFVLMFLPGVVVDECSPPVKSTKPALRPNMSEKGDEPVSALIFVLKDS